MKISYITDSVLDDRIVHATHIDEVCKNLTILGHIVTLYAPMTQKFKAPKSYQINFITTPSRLVSIFYQINLFFRLSHDFLIERPNIIYCRQSQFLFVPTVVGKLFRIPAILEVNGRLIEEAKQINKSFAYRLILKLKIFNILEFFNVKLASGLIVVSGGIKDYLIETYRINQDKIAMIANGVDIEIFRPLPMGEARDKIGLERGSIYIGYIGSLHSWQGLRYVAEAARLICAERSAIKFLIIGDGGDVDYLVQFIQKNNLEKSVELRPAIIHKSIPLYINALDICLSYPLKIRESAASPFKVYEYLACGKPVVVSDIGGIREEFGNAVLYAEAESPRALVRTLISLVDDENKRQYVGMAGRKFIEQGHSWRTVVEKIITFTNKITSSVG